MKAATSLTLFLLALWSASLARADIFGIDGDAFQIDFVDIGDVGNPTDPDGLGFIGVGGTVDYGYRIGQFEISEGMIDKANNLAGLGITHDGRGADKPATSVSWLEAAKFVNWLNTSTGSLPAYKLSGSGLWTSGEAGYNPDNPLRNSLARYFLPSADEWHKAAYYDPVAGLYYDFPTGSDATPDGIDFAGDTTFDAVFHDGGFNTIPNDITDVGVPSPYGTLGQGGNVRELEETEFDLSNNIPLSAPHGIRGGHWQDTSTWLQSSSRTTSSSATNEFNTVGFRVAGLPKPPDPVGQTVLDVTYSDLAPPTGPISLGLEEIPAEVPATFILNGTPSAGLNHFGLEDVQFAELSIGDGTWTTSDLVSFSMTIDFNIIAILIGLQYEFAPIMTPSVVDGRVVNNSFQLHISGTDIASGQDFQYLHQESMQTATLEILPGDFNGDGTVDAADYTVWRDNLGAADELVLHYNGDGMNGVDAEDYALWKSNFGSTLGSGAGTSANVPEPSTVLLGGLACVVVLVRRRSS